MDDLKSQSDRNPVISDQWDQDVHAVNRDFDEWMTRQLNILVARHMDMVTEGSVTRQSTRR